MKTLISIALAALLALGITSATVAQDDVCVDDPAGDSGHVGNDEDRVIWDITRLCITSTDDNRIAFELTWVGQRDSFARISGAGTTTSVVGNFNGTTWGDCPGSGGDVEGEAVGDNGSVTRVLATCFPEGTHTLTFRTFWIDDLENFYEGDDIAPITFTVVHGDGAPIPDTATVVRLSGGSRYETAVEVSQFQFPGGAVRVTLANANVQVDALPGSQLGGGPILYVPATGEVPPVVLDEITRLDPSQIVVLGGQLAVSEEVVEQVTAATAG